MKTRKKKGMFMKKIYFLLAYLVVMTSLMMFGNHKSGNKSLFLELDESVKTQVRMGNNTCALVCEKDTISIMTKLGEKYLHNVMHVLG